ncbi:MAG: fumarate hydratase, partial [Desulfovibrio sp.]
MRQLSAGIVTEAVASLCIDANRHLPQDLIAAFEAAMANEESASAKEVLRQLLENAQLAADTGLPLCQDTGLAVLFVELGEDLQITGGSLKEAITQGVIKGYQDGYLRKSVCSPLERANTGDNTPAIIQFDLVPGDKLKISFMAKGGGSENMSRATMLTPAQGWAGIKEFVINRVAEAGPNPCPPVILGVAVGGSFERAAVNAKKTLLRDLDDSHPDPDMAAKEAELLEAVNKLGIGPMGLGGKTTVLSVKIAMEPCHLASLPLAVNVQCHSQRHEE